MAFVNELANLIHGGYEFNTLFTEIINRPGLALVKHIDAKYNISATWDKNVRLRSKLDFQKNFKSEEGSTGDQYDGDILAADSNRNLFINATPNCYIFSTSIWSSSSQPDSVNRDDRYYIINPYGFFHIIVKQFKETITKDRIAGLDKVGDFKRVIYVPIVQEVTYEKYLPSPNLDAAAIFNAQFRKHQHYSYQQEVRLAILPVVELKNQDVRIMSFTEEPFDVDISAVYGEISKTVIRDYPKGDQIVAAPSFKDDVK